MSVLLRFHTVADKDISDILEEPTKLEILHYGEILDPDSLEDIEEDVKDNILKWTPTIKSDVLYVEGMFQSLHYLLTAETETNLGTFPLNFLNGNRIEVGEIGWGPVTFYNSDDVKIIATTLSEINFSELEKRYDADKFNQKGIYPRGYTWKTNDVTSLLEKIKEIQDFFNETKNKSLGLYRVFV
jgi:hypothetical protein